LIEIHHDLIDEGDLDEIHNYLSSYGDFYNLDGDALSKEELKTVNHLVWRNKI
jgi:hypothetical protein